MTLLETSGVALGRGDGSLAGVERGLKLKQEYLTVEQEYVTAQELEVEPWAPWARRETRRGAGRINT